MTLQNRKNVNLNFAFQLHLACCVAENNRLSFCYCWQPVDKSVKRHFCCVRYADEKLNFYVRMIRVNIFYLIYLRLSTFHS